MSETNGPMYCQHANEAPNVCPCSSGCFCRLYTCRHKPAAPADAPAPEPTDTPRFVEGDPKPDCPDCKGTGRCSNAQFRCGCRWAVRAVPAASPTPLPRERRMLTCDRCGVADEDVQHESAGGFNFHRGACPPDAPGEERKTADALVELLRQEKAKSEQLERELLALRAAREEAEKIASLGSHIDVAFTRRDKDVIHALQDMCRAFLTKERT